MTEQEEALRPRRTEPEFRQMIADIANGELEVVPILADWLTEQGDWRGEPLRWMGRRQVKEFNNGGQSYWYVSDGLKERWRIKHLTPDRARRQLIGDLMDLFAEDVDWLVQKSPDSKDWLWAGSYHEGVRLMSRMHEKNDKYPVLVPYWRDR